MKTAVLYLRVSTASQVNKDYDPEGISLPAQRLACQRKADQMGVTVIGEYVEPGKSGTNIDKRPAFQEMLARLKDERDVDYVVVYNLSRLNRNRFDDAKVVLLMRSFKVTLVSAQENIDETPAGQLMHGMLAAFNEYRSNADGADIRYKMGQKAKSGGTVTRAKIGYENVRAQIDGHEVRTVAIDEERAPYVKLAFELASSGDYTMAKLASVLADRGLRMRPQSNRSANPVSANYLSRMLRDRYYIGIITYKGQDYPGRHAPLVDRELFAKVQQTLDSRLADLGERQRKHHHYLKSALWCDRCHQRGVESRLVFARGRGNGGDYWYYVCHQRLHRACDAPYVRVEDAEDGVLRHYATLRLPEDLARTIRKTLESTQADEHAGARFVHRKLTARLTELDTKEEHLLDLAEGGGLGAAKVRVRLGTIAEERVQIRAELASQGPQLEAGAALIEVALDLLDDTQELYRQTSDPVRRQLNQAIFEKLYIDDDEIRNEVLREPFDGLLFRRILPGAQPIRPRQQAPRHNNGALVDTAVLFERIARVNGSNKNTMVELRGFEPLTPSMRTAF